MADMDAEVERFAGMYPIGDDLIALLKELADAAEECRTHFKRHPAVNALETGHFACADPVAARADWQKAWRRKERAMEAIIRYAVEKYT